MHRTPDRHHDNFRSRAPLRRALLASFGVHLLVVLAAAYAPDKEPPTPKMIAYDVEFVSTQANEAEADAPDAEVKPPEPEPEPPEPEPEPPKPEPEPVAKEEPEPEPEPAPKEEEKPEPPKPEPKKEEPKKEPPKETPKPEVTKPVQVAKATPPKPVLQPAEAAKESASSGPQLKQQLPSALNGWARLVQRKVDKYWSVPGGIRVTPDGAEAVISFWIDRQGRLIGRPEIVENGADPALAESGVRAVMAANPLPPLPDTYSAQEQQVIFAFSAVK